LGVGKLGGESVLRCTEDVRKGEAANMPRHLVPTSL
jgi:hypothetical protein